MTFTVRPAEEWAQMTCKHIGSEGRWPQDSIAEQLGAFVHWQVKYDAKGQSPMLFRRFNFSNFEGVKMALNALIELADQQDHHPEVAFSYGFMEVSWSTHSAEGLSDNDWVCAARLESALQHLG